MHSASCRVAAMWITKPATEFFCVILDYSKNSRGRTWYLRTCQANICQLSPVLNGFSTKFDTGSHFLKSIKTFCILGQIRLRYYNTCMLCSEGGIQNSCGQCFSSSYIHFYINANLVCRFYIRNKLNTTKYSQLQRIFPSENKNLFKNLNS